MKPHTSKRSIEIALVLTILLLSTISTTLGSNDSNIIFSTGSISYSPNLNIYVNPSNVVGRNALALGSHISYGSLGVFQASNQMRQLVKNAQLKLIRFFDGLTSPYIPSMIPCTYFDETTKTGVYDWTSVDDVVGKIMAVGAEPLVCLGVFPSGNMPEVPTGMAINPTTNLPYPESYAAYCAEWVKHFKAKNWPVRFYEILNEPWVYFGQNPVSTTKLGYYMQLFAACRSTMKQVNPNIIASFDYIHKKSILDYWLANEGPDVDSLNFHKYDDWLLPSVVTDAEMFTYAERLGNWYTISEAEQVWYENRGKHLPLICSESNINGAAPTTDPRLQQMAGAVWLALVLRTEILAGVNYHIYFELGSSYYANSHGFGMINNNGYKPWYPYFVQEWIGNNLAQGDSLIYSSSSSSDIRSLAWIHQGKLNMLIINTVDQTRTVYLQGNEGEMRFSRIDNTIPWTSPEVQTGIISSSQPLIMHGYTVMLLQPF